MDNSNRLKYNCIDILQYKDMNIVKSLSENNRKEYSIATFNVKGDLNLGAIIRTSLYFNCKCLFYFRDKKFDRRYCIGTHNYLPIHYIELPFENWLNSYNIYPVFIEQNGSPLSSQVLKEHYNLSQIDNKEFCLIFGNDTNGISLEILKMAREKNYPIISIPTFNVCPRSLSVSMTTGIVLYEMNKLFNY